MSLLKNYITAQQSKGAITTRETYYGRVTHCVPSKPADGANGPIPKLCVTIDFGTDGVASFYPFVEQVNGMPAFIPKEGLPCQLVVQPSKPDADGVIHTNVVYLGVGA